MSNVHVHINVALGSDIDQNMRIIPLERVAKGHCGRRVEPAKREQDQRQTFQRNLFGEPRRENLLHL